MKLVENYFKPIQHLVTLKHLNAKSLSYILKNFHSSKKMLYDEIGNWGRRVMASTYKTYHMIQINKFVMGKEYSWLKLAFWW